MWEIYLNTDLKEGRKLAKKASKKHKAKTKPPV
jgi:hypothetical protein